MLPHSLGHSYQTVKTMAVDLDKENRPPPGSVAVDGKKHTPARDNTPARMRRQTQIQYFDVGKVGRYARPLHMCADADATDVCC